MNSFDITVLLNNNKTTTFAVVPHDNHENAYPTYFQLLVDHEPFSEIRLNDELIWEVCKGKDLCTEDLRQIMSQIESNVYKKSVEEGPVNNQDKHNEKLHNATWFERIVNTFGSKKSAA